MKCIGCVKRKYFTAGKVTLSELDEVKGIFAAYIAADERYSQKLVFYWNQTASIIPTDNWTMHKKVAPLLMTKGR